MANENGTQTTELQEYEVQDLVDTAVASGTFEAYVYQYKKGGKNIQGLSARGVEHIGLNRGISITDHKFEEYEVEGFGKGVLCTAEATLKIVHPTETVTQPDGTVIEREGYEEEISAPGANFSPFIAYGKPDEFCWQKALTKAMRNARLQLIEASYQKEAIKELLKLQDAAPAPTTRPAIPANTQRQSAETNGKEDAQSRAFKAALAAFNDKATELAKLGITKDIFWNGVKACFKVGSRNDMSVVQLKQLRSDILLKGFATWIQDLAPKPATETETATETATETETEADQPF